jgi:hypothetical protein
MSRVFRCVPSVLASRSAFVTTIVATFALAGPLATPAAAQCVPNAGPFCIDGTITDANNSGVPTAATPPGPQALITADPAGNATELGPLNGSTTKINVIHTAPLPMLDTNRQNAQVDLNKIYTQSAISGGHLWFYFGWVRDSNNGSGFISIEFQQGNKPLACDYDPASLATTIAGCNPWANRQDGDFLILWDQNGSNLNPISIRTFQGGAFQPPVVLSTEATAIYGNAASGGTFRGEMALDFTAIIQPPTNTCLTFANVIPSTVTGNSDTADYKDTVLSDFPLLTNCGVVTVAKVTSPASSPGTFRYTLAQTTGQIFGVATVDSDCSVTGSNLSTCIGELQHGQTDTIANLLADSDYTLVESLIPSNFGLTSIVCTPQGGAAVNITAGGTFTVVAGQTTACVITNTVLTGQLLIVKTVVNGFGLTKVPGDFQFTVDGGSLQPFANSGVSCTSGATCKTLTFDVGTSHTVVEPAGGQLAGYTMTASADCTNAVIVAGSPKTCTITNTAQQNTVAATTQQRVLLFDRATITGIRRATGDAGTMSVAFSVYGSLAACNAETPVLASETVVITLGAGETSKQVGTTGTPAVEIKLDTNPAQETTARYWRALFHQTGTSAPNADFKTSCTEITTVTLDQ